MTLVDARPPRKFLGIFDLSCMKLDAGISGTEGDLQNGRIAHFEFSTIPFAHLESGGFSDVVKNDSEKTLVALITTYAGV